jgi:hypothetical protein
MGSMSGGEPEQRHPPAGWYQDPERPGAGRYWSGTAWTEDRLPYVPAALPPPYDPTAPPPPYQASYQTSYHQATGANSPRPVVAPVHTGTNGMAIASLVLGIIWIYWIGSLLAIIFGHVALGQIRRSSPEQGGRGLAIAGLVLGYLGLALLVLLISVAASVDWSEFDDALVRVPRR